MRAPSEIFREYDVRGVVGRDLTPAVALHLGRAAGTWVRRGGGSQVVVGRDGRLSGPELASALCEGIASTGCTVLDIGLTPTPVNYWAIRHLEADGGVHVTGSHNPPEYNGFKLTLAGRSLHGADIQKLKVMMDAEEYTSGSGRTVPKPVSDAYVRELAHLLHKAARPLRLVVDAGNGTGGITAVPLYRQLGYDVTPLFCEPDGRFPNHHADPTIEANLEALRREVARQRADLGIAFDGDADRIGVIDRDGEIVWGDRLLILLARAVLREQPGAAIIGEVKCSKTLYDDVARHGGRPIMWRTGHSLIKSKLKEENAALAGEMSGHIFFVHRYYGFDDAVYTGGRLLEVLASGTASITERLADVPATFSTPEIRLDCPESLKFELVRRVTRHFQESARSSGHRVIDIDGARVEWRDGWGLVRPSNTQPLLVLRFEAETNERLEEIRALFETEIARARRELEP